MQSWFERLFPRRRVKVQISCIHGQFIPGSFKPWGSPRIYACPKCNFRVTLSKHRGFKNW